MSHRRYISEVRFGTERPAVTLFGNRTVYDHWQQIEPVCGQLLLAPQWRAGQARVSFTWQQPGGDAPLSSAELAELRARIDTIAKQLPKKDAAEIPPALAGLSADQARQAVLAKTGDIIRGLAAKPDGPLSGFACRTPAGLRLHSWGGETAAHPLLLETPKQDIRGKLIIEGAARLTGEVLLQNTRGATLERTRPDADGCFAFTGVAQGLYHVRPTYPDVFFATPDVSVSVKRDEPTEVVLRGTWRRAPSAAQLAAEFNLQQQRKRRRRTALLALLLLLLFGVAGRSFWKSWFGRDPGEISLPATHPAAEPRESVRRPNPPAADRTAPGKKPDTAEEKPAARSPIDGADSGKAVTPASNAGERSAETAAAIQPVEFKVPTSAGLASSLPENKAGASGEQKPPEAARPAVAPAGGANPSSANPATSETQNAATPGSDASPVIAAANPNSSAASSPALIAPTGGSNPVTEQPARSSRPDPLALPAFDSPPARVDPTLPSSRSTQNTPRRLNDSQSPHSPGQGAAQAASPAVVAATIEDRRDGFEARPEPAHHLAGASPQGSRENFALNPPPSSSRLPGDSTLAPDAPANAPSGQNPVFPVPPRSSSPRNSTSTPGTVTFAVGSGQHETAIPTIAGGLNSPTSPATSSVGGAKFLPIGDNAAGPGKLPASANPGSSGRGLVQIQSPGSDGSGSRVLTNNAANSGGTSTGTIIGGVSILGGPSAGFGQTPEGASEAPDGIGLPNGTPRIHGTDGNTPAPNAAPHLTVSEPTYPEKNGPRAISENNSNSDPAGPSRGPSVGFSGHLVQVQPKAVLVRLVWELRLKEHLVAPEMAALRRDLLAANRLKMPKTLRDPQTEGGFIIELPHGVEVRPPVWRDSMGTNSARVSVRGNRAEFSWSGDKVPKGADYVLASTEGEIWARITVDQHGLATIATAPGARRWYSVGVVRSPEDDLLLTPADWAQRLQWRTARGKPIPREWRRDDSWREGRGYRIEIPLDEADPVGAADDLSRGIGLVDTLTGWVLSNSFESPPMVP